MNYEIVTTSAEETQKFAEEFAQKVKPGEIITLSGELGAGKTTFVQGFAQGLGITQRIISPTFIIMRTYSISSPKSRVSNFYHIDLYRTATEKDLEGLGLKDIFADPSAITVIEWPERLGNNFPKKNWDICIENLDENKRKIVVKKIPDKPE